MKTKTTYNSRMYVQDFDRNGKLIYAGGPDPYAEVKKYVCFAEDGKFSKVTREYFQTMYGHFDSVEIGDTRMFAKTAEPNGRGGKMITEVEFTLNL